MNINVTDLKKETINTRNVKCRKKEKKMTTYVSLKQDLIST